MFTLPKSERLHGKTKISALMSKGRWGFTSGLKYCVLKKSSADGEGDPNSILVSVPKRLFKRAVRRNLLKRRIREAYRTQKQLLPGNGYSIMILYNSKEVMDFEVIRNQVKDILEKAAGHEAK
jgi:ribonuclease P protein component